jgi:hypothetical protein
MDCAELGKEEQDQKNRNYSADNLKEISTIPEPHERNCAQSDA